MEDSATDMEKLSEGDPTVAIVIPAFNEEKSVESVVSKCLSTLRDRAKVLVVDDGSSDQTALVAGQAGAEVISHRKNKGVAQSIKTGITKALIFGPDILVQLDADGQHDPRDIPSLIHPILSGEADLVVGKRVYRDWDPPRTKRFGNWLLTHVTNHLAGTNIDDAQSGFRAMSIHLARDLELTSRNTYVQEMIIRAAREGFRVDQVDITVQPRGKGKSKVVSSIISYASGAVVTLLRVYRDYEPLRFFGSIGGTFLVFGLLLGSLLLLPGNILPGLNEILGFRSVFLFITVGIQIILFGFLADMMNSR